MQRTGSIANVIKYINENITDDLTLEKISDALFISKYYLCRNFKKTTGMTVLDYVKERRISMAKKGDCLLWVIPKDVLPTDF